MKEIKEVKEMLIQQGDVLLQTAAVPKGAKTKEDKEGYFILAEGEVTGHAHKIKRSEGIELLEYEGALYLKVKTAVPLEHEEHHIIIIEPGEYEVRKVLEREHFSRITRQVAD